MLARRYWSSGVGVAVVAELGVVARRLSCCSVSGVRVQREEAVHVPQRQDDLADAVADALLGDHEVAAAQDRAGHQEPAHGVGAVAVQDLGDVRVVAQALGHLLPVRAQHDAVADDVAEGRTVEQRGGKDVQHVEPAAGLADVLDDEVRRVVRVEPFLVLERVVHLAVGHGAGVEPDVQDVLDAAHHGLALFRGARVIRVRAGELVDERPVQVHLAGLVQRQAAEVGLDLGQGAVDVGARVVRVGRTARPGWGCPSSGCG